MPLCHGLPIAPNLRCGVWYTRKYDVPCYFKSADGHYGTWDFSTTRLNLEVVRLVSEFGGVVIVDATRSSVKRLPDSLSKTIPIWAAIASYLLLRTSHPDTEALLEYLHLPPWVSPQEKAIIEEKMPEFLHKASTADFGELIRGVGNAKWANRPLRCVWVTRNGSSIDSMDRDVWGDQNSRQFFPLVCISASNSSSTPQNDRQGWRYIQGAADDEEFWAGPFGLTPTLFWDNVSRFLTVNPESTEEIVKGVCKLRGLTSSSRIMQRNEAYRSMMLPNLRKVITLPTGMDLYIGDISAIGTSAIVSFCSQHKLLLIECDGNLCGERPMPTQLHLNIRDSKLERLSLKGHLRKVLDFVDKSRNSIEGGCDHARGVTVVCNSAGDVSVCVAIAIILAFDDSGRRKDKQAVRRALGQLTQVEVDLLLILLYGTTWQSSFKRAELMFCRSITAPVRLEAC